MKEEVQFLLQAETVVDESYNFMKKITVFTVYYFH